MIRMTLSLSRGEHEFSRDNREGRHGCRAGTGVHRDKSAAQSRPRLISHAIFIPVRSEPVASTDPGLLCPPRTHDYPS